MGKKLMKVIWTKQNGLLYILLVEGKIAMKHNISLHFIRYDGLLKSAYIPAA